MLYGCFRGWRFGILATLVTLPALPDVQLGVAKPRFSCFLQFINFLSENNIPYEFVSFECKNNSARLTTPFLFTRTILSTLNMSHLSKLQKQCVEVYK